MRKAGDQGSRTGGDVISWRGDCAQRHVGRKWYTRTWLELARRGSVVERRGEFRVFACDCPCGLDAEEREVRVEGDEEYVADIGV